MELRRVRQPIITGILSALILSGCTTPITKEGDAPAGKAYVTPWIPAAYTKPADPASSAPVGAEWWRAFDQPELNRYVERALTYNYDLKAAVYRVAQTGAQAEVVRAAQYPTLDAVAGYQSQAPVNGIGTAATQADWVAQPVYQAGLRAGYEVDLWGKKGFNTDTALQKAASSAFARDALVITLTANVATAYFAAVSLTERIAVARRNLEGIREVQRGIAERVRRGDGTAIDLGQQTILVKNTEANVAQLVNLREQQLTLLAQLVGGVPGKVSIEVTSISAIRPIPVQPGLPSDLLCRRPDIRAAESDLLGAQADLYAARANFLPAFPLTAQGGIGSYYLSTITSPQSLFFNITAQLVQSIFDGGRRKAEEQAANARNFELLEAYAKAVQTAMRDVEDALTGVRQTNERYVSLGEARVTAQKLESDTQKLLEWGAIDFLQLLTIQQTVLNSEDAYITAENDRLKASIDLVKALGGGVIPEGASCDAVAANG